MPLLRNKHQPYFPDPDSPNNYNCDGSVYCHPVQPGDTVMTQFYQTPCGPNEIIDPEFGAVTLGSELVVNGTFTGSATGWDAEQGGVPLPMPAYQWTYDVNNVQHGAGGDSIFQDSLGLSDGEFYQVSVDVVRNSGTLAISIGDDSQLITETGTHTFTLSKSVGSADEVRLSPVGTGVSQFVGWVDNVSVKQITYSDWNPNSGWILADGIACHIEGQLGILIETVADYIDAGEYYSIEVTVQGYAAGLVDVKIANVTVGTITSNGIFTYYGTPTLAGVVTFAPSTTFIGCIARPDLRRLRNDYPFQVISSEGTPFNISPYAEYYQDLITLKFDFAYEDLDYGCYNIEVIDSCTITGDNLVTNPGFSAGFDDWTRLNWPNNYDLNIGGMEFVFEPIAGASILLNSDFAAGFTDWSAGAGWSISGGGALHTSGSTAVLSQPIIIPPLPPIGAAYYYWIKFTISGRTTGSVGVQLSDSVFFNLYDNGVIVRQFYNLSVAGAQSFSIIPTTDFDGSIDDIVLYPATLPWSSVPTLANATNPLMVDGNYMLSFEITATTDPRIRVGIKAANQLPAMTYFTGVGVHSILLQNYVPGGQFVVMAADFGYTGAGIYAIEGRITIDNVSMVRVEPFDATYTSECLNYRQEQLRTKMMVGYCDQPAFGFEFENTGFRLQQRAVVRSISPTYPKEKQIQRSGDGNARVVYSGVEKFWQLHTAFVSETFHDAMSVMVDCDHFLIGQTEENGVEYIAEVEDYTPAWVADGSYSLAPAVINIRVKEGGQLFNRHI